MTSGDAIVEAVLVEGKRIAAVGGAAELLGAFPDADVVDVGGRTILPGLIDTHAHLDREGLKQLGPSLADCRSVDDILQVIEAGVAQAPPGAWIVTMPAGSPPCYWDGPETLREGRLPNRAELDRVAPDNPVYIRPIWGYWRHAPNPESLLSAANSLALARSGIDDAAEPPGASVILHRDADGRLDGRITEHTAMPIVELLMLDAATRFTREDRVAALEAGMRAYAGFGTTSIYEGHGVAPEVFRAYAACRAEGALLLRSRLTHSPAWGSVAGADPAAVVAQWAYWAGNGGLGDEMLSMEGLFVEFRQNPDDLLRARAAPYTGWAGFHYDSALPREQLKAVLVAAARNDIRCVAIAPDIIDLLAEVDRVVPLAGRRWVVQHFGPLSKARCETAARLGLVLTPLTIRYIYKEGAAGGALAGLADPEDHVPLARLSEMGIPVTLGSDNAPPSLFHSVWHATARRDRDGALVPDASQALSRMEALRAATAHGAYLTFEEAQKGALAPGMLADFAVLSDDPLGCSEDTLPHIRSHLSVVGGKVVHDDGVVMPSRAALPAAVVL